MTNRTCETLLAWLVFSLSTFVTLPASALTSDRGTFSLARRSLPFVAERALFLPTGDLLFIESDIQPSIHIVPRTGPIRTIPLPAPVTDFALSPDGRRLLAVGPTEGRSAALFMVVSLIDGEIAQREVEPVRRDRSIGPRKNETDARLAVSPSGEVYISWMTPGISTILQIESVDPEQATKAASAVPPTASTTHIVDVALDVDDIEAFGPGLLIITAAGVLAYSFEAEDFVTGLRLYEVGISRSLAGIVSNSKGPVDGKFIIVDSRESRLFFIKYDRKFRQFGVTQAVRVATKDAKARQLIVGADPEQEVILVGAEDTEKLMLFRWQGETVVQVDEIALPGPVRDLAVRQDRGQWLALLGDGNEYVMMEGMVSAIPYAWDSKNERMVAETQAGLASLGYPVGAIDGKDGPATQLAISLFQASNGIPVDGVVSDEIVKAIDYAVRTEITTLANDLDSPVKDQRLEAAANLIRRFGADAKMVDVVLALLEPPKLEELGANGRINGFVVLMASEREIWMTCPQELVIWFESPGC